MATAMLSVLQWRILVRCLVSSSSESTVAWAEATSFDDGFRARLAGCDLDAGPIFVFGGMSTWRWCELLSFKMRDLATKNGTRKWVGKWSFCQKRWHDPILEKWSFFVHFWIHSEVHFWKMELKMKIKMNWKWPENDNREQPYCIQQLVLSPTHFIGSRSTSSVINNL